MALHVQLSHSATAGEVPAPADLEVAELAANLADLKLYIKDDTGAVQQVNSKGVPTVKPTNPETGDLWIDVTGATPILKLYDGASWAVVEAPRALHTLSDVDDASAQAVAAADVMGVLVRDGSVTTGDPDAYKLVDVLDLGSF